MARRRADAQNGFAQPGRRMQRPPPSNQYLAAASMRAIDGARSKRRRRGAKTRPEAKIKTKPRQRGRIQDSPAVRFPRRFLSPPPSHRLRPDPRPCSPPALANGFDRPPAPDVRRPRIEAKRVPSIRAWGMGSAARAPSVAPQSEGGRKRKKLRAPGRPTPQAGPRPHSTGFHGQQSLKAEGRTLAPIDRSEKNRERFGRWAVSAATAPGDRNPTGAPQAGPAPAERFGALCLAAGKRRAGRPSPTPSPSPSRPGGPAAPLAVEPIGLGEVEPKRSGERPCGQHPRPPAQPAAPPRGAAIDSAKQAQPGAGSNGGGLPPAKWPAPGALWRASWRASQKPDAKSGRAPKPQAF